ncbi:LysE family translocator [Salinicola sp. DM10]|uniref:LysE family translocator n=1 Tax=Salinicola sp. DM10 TaxID=2815721 RepID=UPI001A8DE70D|nr:LysE family translocator [Salinicola sp. DM10]MCE3028704.1 LysE family translocator [Salinicola sp. DM10]
MPSWIPFALFAIVASITPGPTNLLILHQGLHHGFRRTLPAVIGASLAAAALVLLVGLGLGQLLTSRPYASLALSWLGVVWLSWLAWRLYHAPAPSTERTEGTLAPNFGARQAAILQLINPKTWLMALAVVGVFAPQHATPVAIGGLAAIFATLAMPCLAAWGAMGDGAARLLRSPAQWRLFNRALALVLLLVAWWSVLMPG